MEYKILWTDMHSNLHHEKIKELPKWIEQMKNTMDFWPFAYYPYYMRKDESGLGVEDMYSEDKINKDWEYIRDLTNKANESGFTMFMGYEWQGSGNDGDHNVFFKNNDEYMYYPLSYKELRNHFVEKDVIAIPHHLAYKLDNRGKNWSTQDDLFSPFVEIYSSHGSSENDVSSIDMNRHIHMGPRTGETSVEKGLETGHRFGVIASGDNHSCPGVYGFGYCAVLSTSNKKEDIWNAFVNRRVYGVSKERIDLVFKIDDAIMGSNIYENKNSVLELDIKAAKFIDRIEIIKDDKVYKMIPHTSTWEMEEVKGKIRFKFQLELGWGPDRRIFPDINSRKWNGSLKTNGKLISIEKCWSNFGQRLYDVTDNSCKFELESFKTTATGKWMGPSAVTTEGFIFEIEDDVNSSFTLNIDGTDYKINIKDILKEGMLYSLEEEVKKLLKDRYNFNEYYRSDPWWHNAYKIKIHQGAIERAYTRSVKEEIDTTNCKNVRVKVYQKNGGVAWSSPIFVDRRG